MTLYAVRFPDGSTTDVVAVDSSVAARLACANRWPTHSYFSSDSIDCEVHHLGHSEQWVKYNVRFDVTATAVLS